MHSFSPTPPYDFARTIQAGQWLFVMGKVQDGAYRRAIRVGGALALVEVTSRGTVAAPQLDARLLATNGDADEASLWAKTRRIFNVGADLNPFYQHAQHDPVLAQTVDRLYGLHSLQADSLFEAVALTMIEQQISLKMAQAAERWLLAWGDETIEYGGEIYYAFPRPERVAAVTVAELTPLKITFARMQRLIDFARVVDSLEPLRDQPAEIAYEALLGLSGVGHWTAAWSLIRAQGRYAYVGAADVALRAAVNSYYFGERGRAAISAVDQIFARYGAYSGIAAYYTLTRWAFEKY